jgi:type I restriction enzyme S subunit
MAEKGKTPEIRFAGFNDAWEQRRFGNCVLIQRGGSPRPIEEYITNAADGINWVKIGDVAVGSRYITSTKEKIRPEGEKKSRRVFIGDLILSNSMSFGRPYIMQIEGCIHDGWLLIRDENKMFDVEYLLQLLSSNYMLQQYKSLASGGVVNNLNSELVQSSTALIPQKAEQKKLGELFKNLDNLITLHQRKYDKLVIVKKSMLEKMFPKDGANVPEIRFAGFTDAWEQRKLGEAFNQTIEYVNPQTESIELWSLTVENGLTPKTDRYVRDFLVRKEDKYKAVHPNDIVYNPMNITLGAIGYNNMSKTVAVSGYYITMKPTDMIDGYYIKTWMQRPHSINLYKMCATGSLIEKQRVQYPTFAEINFKVPEIKEQKKIGAYFRNIDHLITLHQRQLEKLKNIKQSLLEKMFV